MYRKLRCTWHIYIIYVHVHVYTCMHMCNKCPMQNFIMHLHTNSTCKAHYSNTILLIIMVHVYMHITGNRSNPARPANINESVAIARAGVVDRNLRIVLERTWKNTQHITWCYTHNSWEEGRERGKEGGMERGRAEGKEGGEGREGGRKAWFLTVSPSTSQSSALSCSREPSGVDDPLAPNMEHAPFVSSPIMWILWIFCSWRGVRNRLSGLYPRFLKTGILWFITILCSHWVGTAHCAIALYM